MRKMFTLLCAAICSFAVAETTPNLSGSIEQTTESVAPAYQIPQRDRGNIPTTFLYQPPLVPHNIRNLQVTKNVNHCLGCHAIEPSKTTGATRLPASHFTDRDGNVYENESPRRYFCLQCHVQQTDVNPIIQNKFDNARTMQGN